MNQSADASLEQALAQTEGDTEQTLKAAEGVVRSLRRLRAATKTGNLRELRTSLETGERALASLRQQFSNTRDGWQFDDLKHFEGGGFARELMELAKRSGLSILERDDRLYCYPSLLRVSTADRSVYIDRKREGKVRPSFLVTHLKELQKKPPRFRPEPFLASLYAAYAKVVAAQPRMLLQDGPVVPLLDLYELLTLLPGQAREYTKQEFARDIFLLHRSGVETTKTGARVTFPISRGVAGKTLSVVDESGEERRYFGIAFTAPVKEQ
ncbi:MAG: hypothetical protein HY681_07430 [Chloroflexi bacterium]|nr:hypothetical protein [Chloroflexota bacterium]